MVVRINARTFVGLAAILFDRGFFSEDDTRPTYCVFSQRHEVPVGRTAALRAILAHRRNDDTIAGKNSAQHDWLKKQRQPDAGIMHAGRLRNLAGAHSRD